MLVCGQTTSRVTNRCWKHQGLQRGSCTVTASQEHVLHPRETSITAPRSQTTESTQESVWLLCFLLPQHTDRVMPTSLGLGCTKCKQSLHPIFNNTYKDGCYRVQLVGQGLRAHWPEHQCAVLRGGIRQQMSRETALLMDGQLS